MEGWAAQWPVEMALAGSDPAHMGAVHAAQEGNGRIKDIQKRVEKGKGRKRRERRALEYRQEILVRSSRSRAAKSGLRAGERYCMA